MIGTQRAGDPQIPTYLSHSYRTEDREVNEFFLELLWQHGFAVAVDPPSATLSTVHVEQMMRTSACFVAVVTRRDAQPRYRCSPFAVYEYGLAVQGHRPALVFTEVGVPGRHFRGGDRAPSFDRARLASYRPPGEVLAGLARRAGAHQDAGNRPLGEVGLLLPRTRPYRDARVVITELLEQAGYGPVDVPLAGLDATRAAVLLDDLDFVVLDLLAADVPSWIFPYVRGRGIPAVKLIQHGAGQAPPVALPPLATSEPLEQSGAANQNVIWWSRPDDLAAQLEPLVERLRTPNRPFGSVAEGRAYFRSLGRASGRVFLSSARADNGLARQVGRALDLSNIDYFHYLYHNTIRTGVPWQDRLPRKIAEYPIFVPLLSADYWASPWCQQEYATAVGLCRSGGNVILPYFLDHASGAAVEVQGVSLMDLPAGEQSRRIVGDLDRHLVTLASRAATRGPATDIAIVAARPAEYEAVAAGLTDIRRSGPADGLAWITGRLGAYQVVLARSGPDPAQAVRATVDVFSPDYVILLSSARSVAGYLVAGDIVVSDRVYGFDRPARGDPAMPRPNWNFPTDPVVASVARTASRLDGVSGPDAGAGWTPRIHSGPIAAGNGASGDVPDDALATVRQTWPELVAVATEAIGVVEALETLRRRGRLLQFVLICEIVGGPPATAGAAEVARRLISTGWPSPPRAVAA